MCSVMKIQIENNSMIPLQMIERIVGASNLTEAFRPNLEHGLIREGIEKIRKHFSTPNYIGPKFVADFEEVEDTEERARIMRDAYERIRTLLESLSKS